MKRLPVGSEVTLYIQHAEVGNFMQSVSGHTCYKIMEKIGIGQRGARKGWGRFRCEIILPPPDGEILRFKWI